MKSIKGILLGEGMASNDLAICGKPLVATGKAWSRISSAQVTSESNQSRLQYGQGGTLHGAYGSE